MHAQAGSSHSLKANAYDPLVPDEIAIASKCVREKAPVGSDIRFISIGLKEPAKAALSSGASIVREALVHIYDVSNRLTCEAVVDVEKRTLVSFTPRPGLQAGIVIEEFHMCQAAVRADPRWRAAVARRGVTDFDSAIIDPWTVGAYGDELFPDRRMAMALASIRGSADDVGYGRPVEGVIAYVDLETMQVVEVTDGDVVPLPPLTGNYTPDSVGPLRTDLKPLDISQPEGTSFSVDGNEIRWQKWRFRVGFTPREGLVLYQIAYDDKGRARNIIHRASMSEMLVPYGDPSAIHAKKNVFDSGEYGMGRMANSLKLGCDCLGAIHYFDAHLSDMQGDPITIENAVCLHEEDHGTLWKHYDWRTGRTEVRRSRRLVVSFFATLGNYDYGFYWHFYQTGDIEAEVKLTGVLSTGAVREGTKPTYGSLIAPQLYAPIHQHYFIYRLDMDVDGEGNSLYEVNSVAAPPGPLNPYGSGFKAEYTPLRTEKEAVRDADHSVGRSWLVVNPNVKNVVGESVGYKIHPGADVARPFAAESSSVMKRGGFIAHTLWATKYDDGELYASGDYINQNPTPDGVHTWVEQDRPLENTDLVVWYNVGVHHIPRPEEWPVMPVAHAGFKIKPAGFFDQNPAIDVPPPDLRKSCCTKF